MDRSPQVITNFLKLVMKYEESCHIFRVEWSKLVFLFLLFQTLGGHGVAAISPIDKVQMVRFSYAGDVAGH